MKNKKIEKKLVLSKTTVANLENEELLAIKGGTGTKLETCYTCITCASCRTRPLNCTDCC